MPDQMRVALMQPYFFPYIGYFELASRVDLFVFYDDAAFSKNSWYNRNRIASHSKDFEYIRVAVGKAPMGTAVRDVQLTAKDADLQRSLAILKVYAKAPNYDPVKSLISRTFNESSDTLSSIAAQSVMESCKHLGLAPDFRFSSAVDYDRNGHPVDKVLDICQAVGATEYVNLSGGTELYDCETFAARGIELSFLTPSALSFDSFGLPFQENLSIIDPMMHCTSRQILDYFRSRE